MSNAHGEFVWYELITRAPADASRFYADVVGWTVTESDPSGTQYREFSAAGTGVAGCVGMPEGVDEAAPGWVGYVSVDDLDAAIGRFVAAGGTVLMPARDIPSVGRIALLADPQGLPLYLMRPDDATKSEAFAPERVGHCHWNELTAADQDAALSFFGEQLGWTLGAPVDMGEIGTYQLVQSRGADIGAILPTPPGTQPGWLFYFGVDDIDSAADRICAAGGTIVMGPHIVPGDSYIIVATDPQGAFFGVTGPRTHATTEEG